VGEETRQKVKKAVRASSVGGGLRRAIMPTSSEVTTNVWQGFP